MAVELVSTPAGIALHAELPPEAFAYVDADWLGLEPPAAVPALVVSTRSVRWDGGPELPLPHGLAADAAARLAFGAVAREAARAVGFARADAIEVIGAGVVAATVRRLVRARDGAQPGADGPPQAIVDTTGDPAALEAAMRRLADLGTLVLAGERLGRGLSVDLYPDVHRRGLRLVGVAPALADPHVLEAAAEAVIAEPPVPVSVRSPLPPAEWYRLSA